MGLGLIFGAGLAGAAKGAGEAGEVSLHSMQDAEQRQELVKMQLQLEEQKDLRIQEAAHGYRMEEQGAAFTHEETMQANQQDFLGGEGQANRANALQLGQLQSSTTIRAAGIQAGAATADARIMANASMTNARLAAMGKSIQTLGDGRVVSIGLDPNTMTQSVTPLMDPSNPDKPLMGMKNLDQRTILLAQSFGQEGQRLMGMGQQEEAAKQFEMMRNILNGKDPSDAGMAHKVASPQSVNYLLKNPGTASQFDAQFGKGSAAQVMQMAQQTTTPATRSAAAPATPTAPAGSASGYPAAAPAAAPVSTAAPAVAPAAPAPPTAAPGSTLAQPGQLGSGTSQVGYQPAGLGLVNGNMY